MSKPGLNVTSSNRRFGSDSVAVLLSEVRHALALRQVLANEAVGVLVQTSLPGVMRGAEIELRASLALDISKLMELGAVIDGDGSDAALLLFDELDDAPIELFGRSGPQLSDDGIKRFAFDEGYDAVRISPTHDGVALPVAEA